MMLFVHNYQWKVNPGSWKQTRFHQRGKLVFFFSSTGGLRALGSPCIRWGHWDTKPHAQKYSALPTETSVAEPNSYSPIYWRPLVLSIQQKEMGEAAPHRCSPDWSSKALWSWRNRWGFYVILCFSFLFFFFLGNSTFWRWGFNEEGAPWLASNGAGQQDWSNSCANEQGGWKAWEEREEIPSDEDGDASGKLLEVPFPPCVRNPTGGSPAGGEDPWPTRLLANKTLGQRHPAWVTKQS